MKKVGGFLMVKGEVIRHVDVLNQLKFSCEPEKQRSVCSWEYCAKFK